MVFHCDNTGKDDASGSDDLRGDVTDAEGITGEVDKAAENTGDGVNIFSEDKGYFVDENVANDSSDGSGGHTHDDCYPCGESGE